MRSVDRYRFLETVPGSDASLRVEPHPAADRLTVCRVDTGRGVLPIVCGAPNVAAGRSGGRGPAGNRHAGRHRAGGRT
ncbi:MAG: hypothetical protein MZV70_06990 [Desulfobacterales bacterium]|nr:hypothetical protein [Desulfobacterales bacterium]